MPAVTLSVSGVPEVQAMLARASERATAAAQAVIERYTDLVAREAQGLAPFDIGDLRGSIRLEVDRLAGRVLAGGDAAPYAPYVEFGTGPNVVVPRGGEDAARAFYVNGEGTSPAQPFLSPALEIHRAGLTRDLTAAVRAALGSK